MPVRTGRVSSAAAANATCSRGARSAFASSFSWKPSATGGTGGKSAASMPETEASLRAQLRFSCFARAGRDMSMRSLGREVTKSVRRRAGMVTAPSSSTWAPIQQVMAISRFVATSFRRPSSLARRTWEAWGSVLRLPTALPTTERPLARFSCRQDIFIASPIYSLIQILGGGSHSSIPPALETDNISAPHLADRRQRLPRRRDRRHDLGVRVGEGGEHRLELGRRQEDAARQHPPGEGGVAFRVGALGALEVRHRLRGEEHCEHGAGAVDPHGRLGLRRGATEAILQEDRAHLQPLVRGVVGEGAEGGDAGGHRQGGAGERARLGNGALRRYHLPALAPAAGGP